MATGRSGRRSAPAAGNHLLAGLPTAERAWLQGRCARVSLHVKQVLYRQGEPIDRLYFPDSGVVSLVSVMSDGRCAEVGTVGTEGVIGVHVMYGFAVMPCEALVQADGQARVLRLQDFWADVEAKRRLPRLLCRYAHTLLLQIMQTAACNRLHTIRQRAARWILTMQDRVGDASFPLTQELLGIMLGARRQSVNAVARSLQRAKVIDYRRGQMAIRNRAKLEAAACDCYAIVRDHFATLLQTREATVAAAGTVVVPPACPCCGLQ